MRLDKNTVELNKVEVSSKPSQGMYIDASILMNLDTEEVGKQIVVAQAFATPKAIYKNQELKASSQLEKPKSMIGLLNDL